MKCYTILVYYRKKNIQYSPIYCWGQGRQNNFLTCQLEVVIWSLINRTIQQCCQHNSYCYVDRANIWNWTRQQKKQTLPQTIVQNFIGNLLIVFYHKFLPSPIFSTIDIENPCTDYTSIVIAMEIICPLLSITKHFRSSGTVGFPFFVSFSQAAPK